MLILGAEKRPEFPPPVRYPSAPFHVGVDTLAGEAQVSIFAFWEGWQQGFSVGDEGAELLGVLICLVCSAGLGISGHSGKDLAASGASVPQVPLPGGWLSPPEWGELPHSSPVGSRIEASTMPSSLRLIKGAMHFCSSHATLQITLVGASDLAVQVCSTQAKARVFSCLTVSKSLVTEALVWGRKSWGHSLWSQGGVPYQPEASCWLRGSLRPAVCLWAECKSLGLLRFSHMVCLLGPLPMVNILMVLTSSTSMGGFWPYPFLPRSIG